MSRPGIDVDTGGRLENFGRLAGVGRSVGVDRLRGLAVLAMVVDHVALFVGAEPLRWTVGRVAVPVFFVLGGCLVRRLTWRHAWVFVLGLVLPVLAPWVDSPNVLCWYALGAVLVWGVRSWAAGPAVALVVLVTALANGVGSVGAGYPPAALWALMCFGALVPLGRLAALGERLPGWLGLPGRFPLTVYAGHVLALTALGALLG